MRREDLQGHQPRSQALRVRPREQQSWAGHIPRLPPTAHLQGTWDRAGGAGPAGLRRRSWATHLSGGDLWAGSPLGADGLGPTGCCWAGVGVRCGEASSYVRPVQQGVRLTPRPPGRACIPALPPQPRAQHHLLRCLGARREEYQVDKQLGEASGPTCLRIAALAAGVGAQQGPNGQPPGDRDTSPEAAPHFPKAPETLLRRCQSHLRPSWGVCFHPTLALGCPPGSSK